MAATNQILHDVLARLDALEQRNTAIEHDNTQLKDENHTLRAQVATLEATVHPAPTPMPTSSPLEQLSRRWVLRRGMQAAAATVVAGVLVQRQPQEAHATHSSTTVFADNVSAHHVSSFNDGGSDGVSGATNSTTENSAGVWGENQGTGPGVVGKSLAGVGVIGNGLIGVKGTSSAPGYGAAYGVHTNGGHGVVGDGNGASSAGVLGRNVGGHGIRGEGKAGVVGVSSFAGSEGVYGQHTGTGEGYGVVGDAVGSSGAGMLGRHTLGTGVRGEGKTGVHGKATSGNGVFGESGSGYGAVLKGGRAAIRLVPATTVGKPTTGNHQIGELYLDKVGTLFICTVAGTPGTWKKVTVS
jgi:hypothetical protein